MDWNLFWTSFGAITSVIVPTIGGIIWLGIHIKNSLRDEILTLRNNDMEHLGADIKDIKEEIRSIKQYIWKEK